MLVAEASREEGWPENSKQNQHFVQNIYVRLWVNQDF